MEKKSKKILSLAIRYLILVLFGIFLSVFYKIFLPLTLYPVYFLLNLIYEVSISGIILTIGGKSIEIIGACVAASAYYLLLILNLVTPMKIKKRIYSLLFSLGLLLILNILRIVILSALYVEEFAFFDFTHKAFWYVLSIVFVIGIWFLTVKVFKIKQIPAYSDFKFIKGL